MGFFNTVKNITKHNSQSNTSSSFFSTGSTVQINGQTFTGGDVSVIGNKVMIDGVDVNYSENTGSTINITVQGNCGDITSENGNITVNQNTNNVESKNGTINVKGSVAGSIENKNGNIKVQGNVQGDCTTKNGNISK